MHSCKENVKFARTGQNVSIIVLNVARREVLNIGYAIALQDVTVLPENCMLLIKVVGELK